MRRIHIGSSTCGSKTFALFLACSIVSNILSYPLNADLSNRLIILVNRFKFQAIHLIILLDRLTFQASRFWTLFNRLKILATRLNGFVDRLNASVKRLLSVYFNLFNGKALVFIFPWKVTYLENKKGQFT